jgi:hypothetical protein
VPVPRWLPARPPVRAGSGSHPPLSAHAEEDDLRV